MAAPPYVRSLISSAKRLRIDSAKAPVILQSRSVQQSRTTNATIHPRPGADLTKHDVSNIKIPKSIENELGNLRLPRAVQATYLAPLKRQPTHGIRSADLQLRSYHTRNLEVFADFCMRAAYFLNLPAKGPVPLPKIVNRWTVPRGNFVHKKSQENFERITMRRLIQIQDGAPETVSIWLAFIQKYQYHGVGMKANVWEHSGLNVAADLDAEAERIRKLTAETFELFGTRKDVVEQLGEKGLEKWVHEEPFKGAWGAYAPSGGAGSVPHANTRVEKQMVGGANSISDSE